MKKKLATGGIVAALALVLAVGGTQAAFADSTLNNTWGSAPRGHATFTSYGEIFKVYDDNADGYGIEVEYSYSGHIGTCYNSSGAGTVKTCDLSIPDGTAVQYRIWLMQNGAEVGGTFSGIRDDVA